jgi:hypothetical protein
MFGKKSSTKQRVDRIFIGNKPPPPPQENYKEDFFEEITEEEEEPLQDVKIDHESITYNDKTFEKGDTVKYSSKKEGKLIKIGKKNIIVLRNDNNKERRLKVKDFIEINF